MKLRGQGVQRTVFALVAAVVPFYAFACSDSDTPVGSAPIATAARDAAPSSTVDAASDADAPSGDPCGEIASACHPYDLGAGKQHDCHELAEGPAGASKCATERAACLTACSAANGPLDAVVRFAAVVGAEPFACGSKYASLGTEASSAEPTDLRFYVTGVSLIDEAGADVPLALTPDGAFQSADVVLLDFEDGTAACDNGTAQKNDTIRGKVPFGKYKGVAFTVGVPEALNHTDVATAPTPLNLTGLNWGWQLGRIFFASGVRAETGDAGAANSTVVHIGSTGCTGEPADGGVATCAKSNRATFRFPGFQPSANVLALDVRTLLQDQPLGSMKNGCHSFDEPKCGKPFERFGLDFATGKPTATQTVFAVK